LAFYWLLTLLLQARRYIPAVRNLRFHLTKERFMTTNRREFLSQGATILAAGGVLAAAAEGQAVQYPVTPIPFTVTLILNSGLVNGQYQINAKVNNENAARMLGWIGAVAGFGCEGVSIAGGGKSVFWPVKNNVAGLGSDSSTLGAVQTPAVSGESVIALVQNDDGRGGVVETFRPFATMTDATAEINNTALIPYRSSLVAMGASSSSWSAAPAALVTPLENPVRNNPRAGVRYENHFLPK
jgi:hypothetical protein